MGFIVQMQTETPTFAIRVYRFPEAVSMDCARLTVVAAGARAKLHGGYHDAIFDRRPHR
jgi:hypothetical protein